jgi:hypothetical protein
MRIPQARRVKPGAAIAATAALPVVEVALPGSVTAQPISAPTAPATEIDFGLASLHDPIPAPEMLEVAHA